MIDRAPAAKGAVPRAMRRFTLPQVCPCGNAGSVTLAARPLPRLGERDPHPAIVALDGDFRLDAAHAVICRVCGERSDTPSH